MSIKNAFETLLMTHKRNMTLTRPGTVLTGTVAVAPSNYFRNMAGPDSVTVEGKEFVMTKTSLVSAGFSNLKKGDRLYDLEIGTSIISEVREMFDIGGAVIGYRIRCS